MRISSIFILLILVAMVLLGACNPVVYAPSTHQVPMLKEAGEVAASGGRSEAGEKLNATEIQGSVAITKHLAVMGGYYDFKSTENTLGRGGGEITELAIGYYGYREDKTGPSRILDNWEPGYSYDVFLGYGWGNGFLEIYDRPYSTNTRSTWFDLERFFVQGSFGVNSSFTDLAISSRFTFLRYPDVVNLFPHDGYDLRKNAEHYLWEPALTLRGGYRFIKLQAQVGFAVPLGSKDFPTSYAQGSFSVVLKFRPGWFKKD